MLTISSGPTNSMRGAAFLSGVRDGIVADVGGTSTDVGALVKGFPREAAVEMDIAGVRTNFRMPDTLSIPLGGGSLVEPEPLRIGPQSTGFRLSTDALVFGGRTLTTTDVAVAAGQARVGDPHRVESLDAHLVERVMAEMRTRLESAVDRIKTSAHDVPVILVGGGNILVGDALAGASRVLRPEHAEVANAIGAAIAQVGGQVERVYSLERTGREEAIADCRAAAVDKVVAAGGDASSVEVVDIDEVPLTYVPSNATLIRVKAVGESGAGRRCSAELTRCRHLRGRERCGGTPPGAHGASRHRHGGGARGSLQQPGHRKAQPPTHPLARDPEMLRRHPSGTARPFVESSTRSRVRATESANLPSEAWRH